MTDCGVGDILAPTAGLRNVRGVSQPLLFCPAGSAPCPVAMTSVVVSDRTNVAMADEAAAVYGPGVAVVIPSRSDEGIVGDEPRVCVVFIGVAHDAKQEPRPSTASGRAM